MKTNCPACGASFSLDILVAHDEAREVYRRIFSIDVVLERPILKYLGLFRPAKTQLLTYSRMTSLLNELLPDIEAQAISRNGNRYNAPAGAWVWGIDQVLAVRHTLTLPLKSHGYLYEILSKWDGQKQPEILPHDAVVTTRPAAPSKTFQGMDELGDLENWTPGNL